MKKSVIYLIVVALLFSVIPQVAFAADYIVPYECLTIENGVITACNTNIKTAIGQTVVIPAEFTDESGNKITITEIGADAFLGQGSIKGPLIISEGIEKVGANAFQSCSNITSVSIPETLSEIGSAAFRACSAVTEYIVAEDNSSFKAVEGNLLSIDGLDFIEYACGKTDTVFYVPEGVKKVWQSSIRGAKYLRYIIFPSTLEEIENGVVFDNTALQVVAFQGLTAPTVGTSNFAMALSVYYPVKGTGYTATAFTKRFADSTFFTYTSIIEIEIPENSSGATPAPAATADPNATPAPAPESLSIVFSKNKVSAKYNYNGIKAVKLIVAQYDEKGVMREVKITGDTQAEIDKNENSVSASAFVVTDELEPVFASKSVMLEEIDGLKILLIGNSFTGNARSYIVDIAKDLGVEHITVGNLKISASTLAGHWTNVSQNRASYNYFKRTESDKDFSTTAGVTMEYGIKDEDWDYIILQEHSFEACDPEVFGPPLRNLVPYIRSTMTNPDAKFGWYMTWAYHSEYENDVFNSKFNGNQMAMYNALVNGVTGTVLKTEGIDFIVPVGTAIQNARTSLIGDNFTGDGLHLSTHVGCYTAGMTFIAAITDLDISNVTWVSKASQYPGNYLPAIKEAVKNAIETPYSVTQSTYIE